jgi:hypothetical protein
MKGEKNMDHKTLKAIDIATQIVVAKMQNSTTTINAQTGKDTAEYFKAVYDGIKNIMSDTTD